jgi:tubulin--tyrosine ligase
MHLTNNAVQRFSEGYGSVADGNQLSFKDLKDEMDKIGLCWDDCLKTIHEHIRVTLKATCKLLNPMNRRYSFQIYGYDFMIDKKGYPWLI